MIGNSSVAGGGKPTSEVVACGYVCVTSDDIGAWREFATYGLGMQENPDSTDSRLLLRIDERAWRVAVESGEPGLASVGWEVPNGDALTQLRGRLEAAGVAVKEDPELAAERGVDAIVTCQDPGGNSLEFFHSQRVPAAEFVSPQGARFVTSDRAQGDLGFGHVVLSFPDAGEARRFYLDMLGFRLSDICLLGEPWVFMHVNPRHHSLAFGPVPGPSSFHHFMLEATELDMVGRALDRLNAISAPMVTTIGKHSNDHMVSFYVRSPSGFEVEYGCFGRKIDDATWVSSTYEEPSYWGHKHLAGVDR